MVVSRRVISSTFVTTGLPDNPDDEDFTPSSATGDVGSRRSKRLVSALQSFSSKRVCADVLSSDDSPGLGFSDVLGRDDEGRCFIRRFSCVCPDMSSYYRLFSAQTAIPQDGDTFDVEGHLPSGSPVVSPLLHVKESACGSKAKRGRTQTIVLRKDWRDPCCTMKATNVKFRLS